MGGKNLDGLELRDNRLQPLFDRLQFADQLFSVQQPADLLNEFNRCVECGVVGV
jgi:hypothetical protein